MIESVDAFLARIKQRDPHQPEFHQAVEEVVRSLWPFLEPNPHYLQAGILERMVEPERAIMFRVPWVDDQDQVRVNRGYRIQRNSGIAPYKRALRVHPTGDVGVLKYLELEQVLNNPQTARRMGGGERGSHSNPHGKRGNEATGFCQSLITALY